MQGDNRTRLYFGFSHTSPQAGIPTGEAIPWLLPPSRTLLCNTQVGGKGGSSPPSCSSQQNRVEDTRNMGRHFASSSWCIIASQSCTTELLSQLEHTPAGSRPLSRLRPQQEGGEEAAPPWHCQKTGLNGTPRCGTGDIQQLSVLAMAVNSQHPVCTHMYS